MKPVTRASAAEIGGVIGNALAFDLRHPQGGQVSLDTLRQTVARLFALLDERGVEYLLVGGIAVLQYVEGRNTEDVDLIMAVSALEKLPEIEVSSREQDFARGRFGELRIDILLTSNPLFDEVIRSHATSLQADSMTIRCATVAGLLILKLYALPSLYRQGNFARVGLYENDVATLVEAFRPPLEPLLAELARHLSPTDLAAVRRIVAEIELRIARFGKGLDKKD